MMKQSILVAPRQNELVEKKIPEIGPRDVLVKMVVSGVCASELLDWRGGGGTYPKEHGHEVTGEVVEVGKEVRRVKVGQLVTGLFSKGFAEYVVADEDRVIPVPEGVHPEAALGEPISCVISGVRRTRVEPGDTVVVIGLGFMGLLTLQAISLRGPARVIAVDLREEALEKAKSLGAHETYRPDEVPDRLKMASWDRLGQGYGAEVVIEASGSQAGLSLASELVREHGFLSIVGYHQGGPRSVDVELWNWKAIDVLNAHERRADAQMDSMRRGLDLVARGLIDVASLVSHRFSLGEVDRAFQALDEKPEGFCKSIILG